MFYYKPHRNGVNHLVFSLLVETRSYLQHIVRYEMFSMRFHFDFIQ